MSEIEKNQEKQGGGTSIPIRVTDRRPRFDGDSAGEAPVETPPRQRYPTFVAELEARASAAEGKLVEALDLLRRREADADEFRARLRREMEKRSRAQVEAVLREFLEVMDSLDRGVSAAAGESDPASLREGLAQVRDQFLSSLARQGVEPMNLLGTEYDPHLAEAVAVSPAAPGEEANRILEEVRRGFTLQGQVLRPAQVRVSHRPALPAPEEGEEPASPES